MGTISIRDAKISDTERLWEIYGYYVRNTAISFDLEPPTMDEFRQRMETTMKRYPYLVILSDGAVEGYACAGPFKGRAAYDWSCETTIYLAHGRQKRGMGRMLYEALEHALSDMGITNLYACIGYPEKPDEYLTRNSADFHAHVGYAKTGVFHNCGYKFNRWYHMIWMEKIIGAHVSEQPPVVNYHDVRDRNVAKGNPF